MPAGPGLVRGPAPPTKRTFRRHFHLPESGPSHRRI